MLTNLDIKTDYLNNVFLANDFDFINSLNNKISEIDIRISHLDKLKIQIEQLISSLSENLKLSNHSLDSNFLYQLTIKVENIFELITENLQILVERKNKLKTLDAEVVALFLEIEKGNSMEDYYEWNARIIKNKIDNYSLFLEKTNSTLIHNDQIINTFMSDEEIKKLFKDFNIQYAINAASIDKPEINEKDNNILIISEKEKKVFLPYTLEEVNDYLTQFPEQYSSFESVVVEEFIFPLDYYMFRPVLARFREAYSLCRDREAKPILESLKYGMDLMFNKRLNPAIIAACKTQEQLARYLDCLEKNNLNNFKDFEIRFEINPL